MPAHRPVVLFFFSFFSNVYSLALEVNKSPAVTHAVYRYVLAHRVGFLRRFGLKTGIHFAHFGLESGMVLEGTTGLYERLYRFNSRRVRKKENVKNMRIRNGLKNFEFVCALI